MFGFGKKKMMNEELETILKELHVNASNNYKDLAKKAYFAFEKRFLEMKDEGSLTEKQLLHYEDEYARLKEDMKGYSHGEQKPDYKAL